MSSPTQEQAMTYHDNVVLFRSGSKTMHVIRIGGADDAVDALRDLLASLATHRISTASKHVFWTEADGTSIKLTCRRLTAVLEELNVEFQQCCNDSWVPMRRPPPRVLSVFLSMAATCDWFAPGECGVWNRANNPPCNKAHAL